MKQKIFIGSSSESARVAQYVKKLMEPEFECTIWTKGFFEMNRSTYESLIKNAICFDYAIFIGGKDDLVIRRSKKEKKNGVRDNVYLELGLYAGILSPERSYFLIHKECKVASDLQGITLNYYKKACDVKKCCDELKEIIKVENNRGRFSLLPSTSLAYGYYDNYVYRVCESFEEIQKITIKGKEYKINAKEFDVILLDETERDWQECADYYCKKNKLLKENIRSKSRDFGVYIDPAKLNQNILRVVDVAQTLRSSFYCVDKLMAQNFIGKNNVTKLVKEREILNFKNVLQMLVESKQVTRNCVKISVETV